MMDWTDRHDRVFLRQFTKHALLSIEMVTNSRWANLEHEIPPALSIIDNSLPPNNVSWSLVSPGNTCSISVTGSLE